ncbi:MAG: hypothetical protein ACPGXX_05305, partial [Planctomycetaceae bacterium]
LQKCSHDSSLSQDSRKRDQHRKHRVFVSKRARCERSTAQTPVVTLIFSNCRQAQQKTVLSGKQILRTGFIVRTELIGFAAI